MVVVMMTTTILTRYSRLDSEIESGGRIFDGLEERKLTTRDTWDVKRTGD